MTKSYYKNGQKKSDFEKLLEKSSDCTKEILEAKNIYILKMMTKFQDPKTAAKTYWAILSRLLYKEKILAIPPLFVNGKFVSNFCEKTNLFNNFFALICTPIKKLKCITIVFRQDQCQNTSFDTTEEDISLLIKI